MVIKIVIQKDFEMPQNPFHVPRNELLHKDIKSYKKSISLIPFKIPELLNIFNQKDIILIGAPGIGKSSLMRILVWDVLLEINQSFEQKFEFIKKFLCDKEKIIPFFGFYINLNEDIRKDFTGSSLSIEEYKKLFMYYFSLMTITRFIKNLTRFLLKMNLKEKLNIEIKWTQEKIPKYITRAHSLKDVLDLIMEEIQVIQDFLSSYDEVEDKKRNLRFDDSLFFSEVINDIIKALNINIERVFLILDDLSFIPDDLIKYILEIFGKRFNNVEIKLSTRHRQIIRESLSSLDRRDLIKIDLDYFIANMKKRYFFKMAKEIITERLNEKKYSYDKLENVFPSITEVEEVEYYDHNIRIEKDDRFFQKIINDVKPLFENKVDTSNFYDYIIGKKELDLEILETDNLMKNKISKLPTIYNILNQVDTPIRRKILEIIVSRKFNGMIDEVSIDEIIDNLNKLKAEIDDNMISKKISLHLLAIDARRSKIYSGFEHILIISSNVIKLLLEILERIFEKFILSQMKETKSLHDNFRISFNIQNEAIHEYAKEFVEKSIRNESHYGPIFFNFLKTIENYFKRQFSIKASYRDGHTGFAFSSLDDYYNLRKLDVFNEALGNSYLISKDISKGYSDEYKKQSHYTLYLNRIICVYFNFPIDYGGYRTTTYNEIINYLLKGQIPPQKKEKKYNTLDSYIK